MPTEQIKIEAKFDGSQLKKESKETLRELKTETNNLRDSFEEVERTAETSLDNTTRKAESTADAMQKISREAKNAAEQIKQVNLKQGVGMAARAVGEIGSMVKENAGDSTSLNMLGGSLQGAAMGAQVGANGGPVFAAVGAAAGLLGGAAAAQIEAANKLKEAALNLYESTKDEAEALLKPYLDAEAHQTLRQDAMALIGDAVSSADLQKIYNEKAANVAEWQSQEKTAAGELKDIKLKLDDEGTSAEDIDDLTKRRQDAIDALKQAQQNTADNAEILAIIGEKLTEAKQRELEEEQARLQKEKEEQEKLEAERKEAERKERERLEEQKKRTAELERAAKEQFNKEKQATLDKLKNLIDEKSQEKDTYEDEYSKWSEMANNFRLTDALTKIGGGSGYGGLNESAQSNIAGIASTVKSLLKRTESILDQLKTNYNNVAKTAWG